MIKAIIVEDEERSRKVLKSLINGNFQDINIIAEADDVETGIQILQTYKPDLVFLDIQLKSGTGFEILEKLNPIESHVIFTTAYDNYALKAFKYSAVDYLLKPIILQELEEAIRKFRVTEEIFLRKHKIDVLLSNLNKKPSEPPTIMVSNVSSYEFIKVDQIVRCEAEGSYCKIFLKDGTTHMVSKVIKEFEALLSQYSFFRVHQSHLININFVKKYIKGDNILVMRDGKNISIARRRKEDFFAKMNSLRL